ncbi:MAG TPA: ethanolamine ammonia-lyase subunit EutC [Kineosporiaceae bacterium]|nr:ethanolamine ammonia-lyase subunit EutC [Kineosporiaceae bacterium]
MSADPISIHPAGVDLTDSSPSASEPAPDFWTDLRRSTQSRIGLGRVGDAMPTGQVLEFRQAHAIARDAVHDPLDVAALVLQVAELGLGEPAVVASRASGRAEYLRRPDLGRLPADLSSLPSSTADVGVVLCDGLSALAVQKHGAAMLAALIRALPAELTLAAPVIATQARVALGDHIGAALGVRTLIVLIGERPGLSVADSLGVYLTHRPEPGRTDADRNCVSNIHPPEGLGYAAAATVVASLVAGARVLGRSGVDLKDSSRQDEIEATRPS